MTYNIIIGILFLLGLIVNYYLLFKVKKYSQHKFHLNGKEIAEQMLNYYGIIDIQINYIDGQLTDHYNPLSKTINLSYDTYHNRNISSVAIASHECAHAIQHKICYNMFILRSKLIPIINFCSQYTNLVILTGLYYPIDNNLLLNIGIGLLFLIVIFSLITLPIEFDASTRALNWLNKSHLVSKNEYFKIKDSLKWAAFTYIITALGSLYEFIYFFSKFKNKLNNYFK
ncbi:MAG: zinc metallopeptidase [Candidatus Bostrichicola ureolyticus]|nr:MAG: zinc metallopeptidase [Candidatus Bostrichicola ureolyticus]